MNINLYNGEALETLSTIPDDSEVIRTSNIINDKYIYTKPLASDQLIFTSIIHIYVLASTDGCLWMNKMEVNKTTKADITKRYAAGDSMRNIALHYSTNHKRISRILKGMQVATRKPTGNRGCKFNDVTRPYNNMASHLRFDVTYEWLMKFDDIDKLRMLNLAISWRGDGRWHVDTEWYKAYITKFYYDDQFNKIYGQWDNNKTTYLKPSIDHIHPKAKGGTDDINNLQFLTWFENRCKNDMTQAEWNSIKENLTEYLI